MKKQKGFTIIELMVIIAILGLISSVILANLQGTREKAKVAANLLFQGSVNSALGADIASKWNFDEGVPGTPATEIPDSSGNNNNGTVVGNATYVEGINGETAILLDNNAYIAGGGLTGNSSSAVTIAAWVSPTNVTEIRNIFQLGNVGGTCTSFGLGINSGNLTMMTSAALDAPKVLTLGGAAVKNSVWQFIVWSFDTEGNVETYIDGVLVATSPNFPTGGCPGEAMEWTIGGTFPGSSFSYEGIVDNVAIYYGSLSGLQISQLYKEQLLSFFGKIKTWQTYN